MKALIIYDDVACAKNANAVLDRAARRADVALKWDISPWRLDLLKSPLTTGDALRDAVDADLILFAVRNLPGIHGWLLDWLQQWVSCRLLPEAALAYIGDGTAPTTVEMSRFARLNGLSFIFGKEFLTPDRNQALPSMPPPPPTFMHPATGVGDFGRGIND